MENAIDYTLSGSIASIRCVTEWMGDGRCDMPNNHDSSLLPCQSGEILETRDLQN